MYAWFGAKVLPVTVPGFEPGILLELLSPHQPVKGGQVLLFFLSPAPRLHVAGTEVVSVFRNLGIRWR
jgi:hypothetical protein